MEQTTWVEGNGIVRVYRQAIAGHHWLERYQGQPPLFACVLGFTQTGLLPGISAAGATPESRRYTAIADAEFLMRGPQSNPVYPLPPLQAGASPVLISRALCERQQIPIVLFNAGLPKPPAVTCVDLGGEPADCLSGGQAIALPIVKHLLQQGLDWGQRLATESPSRYLVIGECVVGGTTTALGILRGLGFAAEGKINSSHPSCNHSQKAQLVQMGLERSGLSVGADPLEVVAGVGDPMQIVVAGMAIAASRHTGVLLAGGTQMLAVYALARAIARTHQLLWQPEQVVVGTTRWVAEDPTGDTVGLAEVIGEVPLLATQLSFALSRYEALRAYERGFVKEGMGAGGCAIAASLYQGWNQAQLLAAIEDLAQAYAQTNPQPH